MNSQVVIDGYYNQLVQEVGGGDDPPTPQPLGVTPWIAMSVLQKAIRRGREDLALRAAATLLQEAPERLWRRCAVIGFEDVGMASIETVGLVTAAMGGKRVRASLGGEWRTAAAIVVLMARAPKCRAADDLYMVTQAHPSLQDARERFEPMHARDLLEIATGPASLLERALALSIVVGSPYHARDGQGRRGAPQAAFDHLCEAGLPHTVVELARAGYRRTGETLCPLLALLAGEPRGEASFEPDDMPPEIFVGDAPSWSLDTFTREGRAAFARFLQTDAEAARWIRGHVVPARRVHFLGNIVFCVEGEQLAPRMRWLTGDEMRWQMHASCVGQDDAEAMAILDLMRSDLPILDRVRAELNGIARHD